MGVWLVDMFFGVFLTTSYRVYSMISMDPGGPGICIG